MKNLKSKTHKASKLLLSLGSFITFIIISVINPAPLESANLTSATDTLQTSRLSYSSQLAAGHNTGDTIITVDTGGGTPNVSTTGLFAGDSIVIGTGTYTVQDIIDADEFSITSGLLSGDTDAGDPIYYKSYSRHDIDFTSTTSVANGSIKVYLQNTLNTANASDGNPDGGSNEGTDLNSITGSNVTCPTASSSTITFTTPVATRSGDTGSGGVNGYHTFECSYSGTLDASDTLSNYYLGDAAGTTRMINPAPGTGHTAGVAETYVVKVEVLDSMANSRRVVDSVQMAIAFIESVRVTATVDPSISYTICGADTCNDVEPGDTVDGETLSSNTGATSTATTVALGSLSLSAARLQAQKISIATNASSGYTITAIDDGNLRKGTDDIDDNVTPPTAPAVLNTPGTEEYGIHPCGTHVNAATWGTGSDSCSGAAGTNEYSGTDTSNILTLVNYSTGPTSSVDTYVNYKANISALTAQGDYAHIITYIATGTF